MTITNKQIGILMRKLKQHNQLVAAAKAGMNIKTARKYIKGFSDMEHKVRKYKTRKCPFANHFNEIESMLVSAPELQATTILTYLMDKYPGLYSQGQLRSLQNKLNQWRAGSGKDKPVIFCKKITPGKQSQSDWTNMNELDITIAGESYPHLLFHFMLPYSRWETITICKSESFDTLATGFEKAVWELGGVLLEHRTDNLSAATKKDGNSRSFTERWVELLKHYKVKPSRNNPGASHENGSVEKSHDIFKNAVNQHLLLRGSRNFANIKDYESFLTQIKDRRNSSRKQRVAEEMPYLKKLPDKKYNAPSLLLVRVNPSSTVNIFGIAYSVPSRLISYTLKAHVYPDRIGLYYGSKCLQEMPRSFAGYSVDYRHIIDSLLRKPGAFLQYQYLEALFPQPAFRVTYDGLVDLYPGKGHKLYLKILQFAKIYGEQKVAMLLSKLDLKLDIITQLSSLLDTGQAELPPVKISEPALASYDRLHSFTEVI